MVPISEFVTENDCCKVSEVGCPQNASRSKLEHCNLRSKRFRRAFRGIEAFFAFVALAPIFAQPISEKCLKRAKKSTETLATQARSIAIFVHWSFQKYSESDSVQLCA